MMRRFSNLAIGAGVPSSVQVIEVEVDTWLGHVRVLNVHTGIAVGKIAAPALAHSQAAGSVIQGIGYALYEAREIDPRTGDMLSGGIEDYRIPGIADTPADRRAFRRRRFRSCARRQRRHRRGRHRPDLAGDRQRDLQRDRHPADRNSRSGLIASSPRSKGGPPHEHRSHDRRARSGIPRRRHRSFRAAPQRRLDRTADRYRSPTRHDQHAWGADGTLRIGAFTTIAAIAADAPHRRRLSRPRGGGAGSGDAADPSPGDARRQSRAALALLVLPQSADRLPEEGRRRIARRDQAIISTASPSTSAPASRRIPRPWPRRLLAYDATVVTDRRSGLTIAELLGDGSNGAADNALEAGRIDQRHRAARRSPASARSTSAPSAAPMRNGRWSRSAPAPWSRRHVPVHPHHRRRRRAGAAPACGGRSRLAGQAGECREHRQRRRAGGSGAKPLPMTGYKLDLLQGVVHDLLERLAGATP